VLGLCARCALCVLAYRFPPLVRIGTRPISSANAPYVIAELGVNHDGSPQRALELTRLASRAGADAIKLQFFRAELLMSGASRLAAYQASAGETDPRAMLRRLELSLEDMAPVVELAHSLKMHAIVTVFSEQLVPLAEQLPWDAYKTASPDIIHKPLLEALARTGKPIILSTGASTLQEVGRAMTWLRSARDRLAVLQCVSSYPTPEASAALGGIGAIADIFDGPVGYSDHTSALTTGARAVAAGACVLEKHMTDNKLAAGPDHAASLTWDELRRYRSYARIAKRYEVDPKSRTMLDTAIPGDLEQEAYEVVSALRAEQRAVPKVKEVLPIEHDVRAVSRQSLVAACTLKPGDILTRADVVCKRPGLGIPPFELDQVIGRKLVNDVPADQPVQWADLSQE
jgi:N,N'-diacetyllegionaminate synthase